jgi:DNA polymerase-3 subunit chi
MARVDFYVLADSTTPERFACSLSNKIRKQGLPIYIQNTDRQSAEELDKLLWTFRDTSFLPHKLADDQTDAQSQIKLGWHGITPDDNEVLINLGEEIPDFANTFNRVIEIVVADEASRGRSREHYKQYQELGFEIHSHKLEPGYA